MRRQSKLTLAVLALASMFMASASLALAQQNAPAAGGRTPAPPPMKLSSTGFTDGSTLPAQYTCDSKTAAVSPELQWTDVPPGTVSFVLITHDMEPRGNKGLDDSLHWILWNIPGTTMQLPEGASAATIDLPDGSHQSSDTNRGSQVFAVLVLLRACRHTTTSSISMRSIRN